MFFCSCELERFVAKALSKSGLKCIFERQCLSWMLPSFFMDNRTSFHVWSHRLTRMVAQAYTFICMRSAHDGR